jgi:hypothetical protein
MKVYESSHPTQRDYTKIPQIKIRNKNLFRCGFEIGKEFEIIYQQNKITLVLVAKDPSNR